MKPKSFNRNMKRELADTLAAHGIVAVVAAIATVSAWDYASWWMASLASDLSTLLHLQVGDPGAEPDTVLRNPLDTLADTLATGKVGGLLAAVAAVAVTIMVLGLVSWARSWLRLHDGTFAGDRAPTRTHGDAWLESRPSRVVRRCPPWDGKEAARGLVAAGCVGGGIAMVPAIHCLIRAGSGAGKSRRALAPSIAAAIDRNAHGIPTSVIVHDPKSEIRAWTEPLARRAGMEVVAIRLDEPVKSARFNPLDRAIAALGTEGVAGAVAELRELSSAIVPDAFSSGQRFFTDASRNLLTGLCLLAIADERIPDGARNLSTVLALLEPRDGKSAVKSLEELAADLPAGNPARQFLLVASSNGGGGEALVSTARNYLMSFCDDDVSRMLWGGEVDLASVGRKPTILYIASATDRGDRGALVSCIFSQALSALRETARLSGGRLPAETLLAIDEGSGIPKIPRLLGDLAEVRSIGLHVVFVLQNTRLLEARCGYSRAESDALLALLGTQVVLSVESVGEAEEISKRLGDYSVKTTGQSSTKGTQSSSSGKSFSVARRPLITPSELMAWSARERRARDRRGGTDGARQPRHHGDVLGAAAGHDVAGGRGRAARAGARGGGPQRRPGTGLAYPGEAEKAQGVAVRRQEAQGVRGARRVLTRHTALPAQTALRHTALGARMTEGRRRLSGLTGNATSENGLGPPSCAAKSRAPVVRPYPAPTVQGTWAAGVPHPWEKKSAAHPDRACALLLFHPAT